MGWYRVVKTIKGHRYEYLQRTGARGKRVRTESRYIGLADGGGGRQAGHGERLRRRGHATAHLLSRSALASPSSSDEGTFGPGLLPDHDGAGDALRPV
jgi:hypothetical protein